MSDIVTGSIEFGVFLVLVLAVFLAGLDHGPDPEEIEMGSGRRPEIDGAERAHRRLAA